MLEKKIKCQNNKGKLKWSYHGEKGLHLEGRIIDDENRQLKIGLASLWPEDIRQTTYEPDKKTFSIYVATPDTPRIALLTIAYLYVPSETEKIKVYDA